MKVQLANHLGVFNPGDEYETTEKQGKALIEHGYAYDPSEPGPDVEPWDGHEDALETAEREPPREKAVKKRGRPKGSKSKKK